MSLAVVLLTPLMTVLMFLGVQAAMWNHSRAEARVVARETAVLVARDHVPAGSAAAHARRALADRLEGASVQIQRGSQLVVVVVHGRAPGMLRGTSSPIRVSVAVPVEGWVPWGG